MKNIFIALFCLGSVLCSGQGGFFLQPGFDAGTSNIKIKSTPGGNFDYSWYAPTTSVNIQEPSLRFGYQLNNWIFSAGLGYLKTGYVESQASYYDPPIVFKITEYYYHLMLPLQIGYQINLGRHFFLLPEIGGEISDNIKAVETTTFQKSSTPVTLSATDFNQQYKRISAWGVAQINAGYKINKRLSVTIGVGTQYMLTSLLTDKNNYQKNYTYTANVGIMWYFRNMAVKH